VATGWITEFACVSVKSDRFHRRIHTGSAVRPVTNISIRNLIPPIYQTHPEWVWCHRVTNIQNRCCPSNHHHIYIEFNTNTFKLALMPSVTCNHTGCAVRLFAATSILALLPTHQQFQTDSRPFSYQYIQAGCVAHPDHLFNSVSFQEAMACSWLSTCV